MFKDVQVSGKLIQHTVFRFSRVHLSNVRSWPSSHEGDVYSLIQMSGQTLPSHIRVLSSETAKRFSRLGQVLLNAVCIGQQSVRFVPLLHIYMPRS